MNYSNTLHAEEVALAKALSTGESAFSRVALSTTSKDGPTPCGMGRQTLAEYCDPSFEVVSETADGFSRHLLGELLPSAFTADLA